MSFRIVLSSLFVAVFATAAFAQETAKIISSVEPVFPAEATNVIYGPSVRVAIRVDKAGKVTEAQAFSIMMPCKNLADPMVATIHKAAENAAKQAIFEPVVKDGKHVSNELMLTYPLRPAKAPAAGDVKTINGGVLNGKGKPLGRPVYPSKAKIDRIGGSALIEILVGEDGSVLSAAPRSGHPYLAEAALWAACDSKFAPTLLEGKPVRVVGTLTYNFVP